MALESRIEDIGDALISWFSPRVSSLGLVTFTWHPHMRANPSYPHNPRTACPRAYLRANRVGHIPGKTIGCTTAEIIYQCSIWLQMRQTPGQAHQKLLIAGIDVFHTALIQSEWRFDGISVPSLQELTAQPAEGVVFDELDHPLGDPALRISSAEIAMTLTGRLRE